jgi:signal transduction histidine kinase
VILFVILPLFVPIDPLTNTLGQMLSTLLLLFFPLSIGFAILRYRLWDIDLIINRTLVYGALTASIIGMYTLVVGYFSLAFQIYGSPFVSILATGLVAVLFQPLRNWLQQLVNHLMYGERDDPYQVLSRLGSRLEAMPSPETILPTIVETVAHALRLPYTAIRLKQNDELEIAASYGSSKGELVHLPLVYQTEQVGELLLAPRAPGESFTPADRVLLNDLARQAGVAAHAVQLTADLKRLTIDLQHSRERLITAREEERRRLRRDLHDGLGPTLGHLTLQLDGVSDLISQDPSAAITQVAQLKANVQDAMNDIRRLVYELRPPALDELGLVTALREQAAQYHYANGLKVMVEAPASLPLLPAAVEVAAYRIALEALTNVVRHAQARTCRIILTVGDELVIEIVDDGQGLPGMFQAGVGLLSMRERATELGGTCVVEARSGGGTCVHVRLPLSKE